MSKLNHCLYCGRFAVETYGIGYSISYENLEHPEQDDFAEDCYDLCPKCFKKVKNGKISLKKLAKKRNKELAMLNRARKAHDNYTIYQMAGQEVSEIMKGDDEHGSKENCAEIE